MKLNQFGVSKIINNTSTRHDIGMPYETISREFSDFQLKLLSTIDFSFSDFDRTDLDIDRPYSNDPFYKNYNKASEIDLNAPMLKFIYKNVGLFGIGVSFTENGEIYVNEWKVVSYRDNDTTDYRELLKNTGVKDSSKDWNDLLFSFIEILND